MGYHNSILQYRPPIDAICVELPAGLIDGDETAGSSGVRELEEETGYAGEVVYTGQVVYSDPGMSKANMRLVTIECDLKEGEAPPVANLEDGEFIEVRVTPLARTFHSFIVGRMFTD
jgi:ADP-ribose pyrophosphatase